MFPALDDLLKYQNNKVLMRYQSDYPKNKMPAKQAFSELLKFIWICLKHQDEQNAFPLNDHLKFQCVMHEEMKEIDDMWHTFLLFTRDYQDFCQNILNVAFFHHQPFEDQKSNLTPAQYEHELTRYLSYVFDHLGEQTLKTWFKI